jgi:hypothetical protein
MGSSPILIRISSSPERDPKRMVALFSWVKRQSERFSSAKLISSCPLNAGKGINLPSAACRHCFFEGIFKV